MARLDGWVAGLAVEIAQRGSEVLTGTMNPGFHCANGCIERYRDFFVTEFLLLAEEDSLSLVVGEGG
jgi:hypothetical protein